MSSVDGDEEEQEGEQHKLRIFGDVKYLKNPAAVSAQPPFGDVFIRSRERPCDVQNTSGRKEACDSTYMQSDNRSCSIVPQQRLGDEENMRRENPLGPNKQ
jgi:hypothetical protein